MHLALSAEESAPPKRSVRQSVLNTALMSGSSTTGKGASSLAP